MIKINLLPKELAVHRETNVWTLAAVAVPVLALGVLGTLHFMRVSEDNRLTEEMELLRADIQARQEALATVRELERQKRELSVYGSVRSTLEALSSDWRGDIERFVGQIPTGSTNPTIALNTLEVTAPTAANANTTGQPASKVMTIQGTAKTNQALIDFVKAFENSQDFAIQFQNAQKQTDTSQYDFTVNVNLIKASTTESAPTTNPADPASTTPTTPTTTTTTTTTETTNGGTAQ